MTFALKTTLALASMLLLPGTLALVALGKWSQDNIDLTIPAAIYLVPIFLVALVVRRWLGAKRTAIGIFTAGMSVMLVLAIGTLWGELHAPVFARSYIPTIVVSFSLGLWALRHPAPADEKEA